MASNVGQPSSGGYREVGAAVQGAASPCSAAPDPNATEGAAPVDMEARHGRGSQGGTCWGALLAQSDGSGCTPNFKTGRRLFDQIDSRVSG